MTRPSGDLLLGLAVVMAMSAGYLYTGAYTVTAPASTPTPAIVPVVICVVSDPARPGSYVASFGYLRADGTGVVQLPYATTGPRLNYVTVGGTPLPREYGVPTSFESGFQPDRFVVRALDAQRITWWLTSDQTRSVEAGAQTQPVCPAVPAGAPR